MLIIGGSGSTLKPHTHFLNFANGRKSNCLDDVNQWHHSSGAAGGVLQAGRVAVLCGGYVSGYYSLACYTFNQEQAFANMSMPRGYGSAVAWDENTLWVTGGTNGLEKLSSTELVSLNEPTAKAGPELPKKMQGHCMVKFNKNHVN